MKPELKEVLKTLLDQARQINETQKKRRTVKHDLRDISITAQNIAAHINLDEFDDFDDFCGYVREDYIDECENLRGAIQGLTDACNDFEKLSKVDHVTDEDMQGALYCLIYNIVSVSSYGKFGRDVVVV